MHKICVNTLLNVHAKHIHCLHNIFVECIHYLHNVYTVYVVYTWDIYADVYTTHTLNIDADAMQCIC